MPLDNFITRPDFSRQIKQFSGTTAFLAGSTNISEKLVVKNIEIDTFDARTGHVLVFNGTKFVSAPSNSYGNTILNGMILSYNSGLTYNISSGEYRINGINYPYSGGSVTIVSGNSLYNRFDVVYVTGDSQSNDFVLSGGAAPAPTVPSLISEELQVGIISVPANFTGGTGSTIIQVTSNTVFDYYAGGTGIFRAGAYNAEAIGQYSFAPSRDAKAYGQDSVAMGLGVKASGNSQTVVGQYNDPNTTDAFIVGNGASDGSRANAFRVTTSGSSHVQNKLFVSNVEVETTGASSNHALIYDGTKFKSQLLTLQKITESGNTTTNSIGVNQLTGTSIFLSSGFTFISGYNSYSDPSDYRRPLLSDEYVLNGNGGNPYGGFPGEASIDIYQLNYFTEKINKGINPLTRDVYSSFTLTNGLSQPLTATSITVGKESYVAITGITSGDTAIGTIVRNRFQTLNYRAANTKDNSSKNLVGTAFFNQFDSGRFNSSPVLGTLMETHLLGSQTNTRHYEVRNLQLGFFNKAWVNFVGPYPGETSAINITTSAYDLYINRPIINTLGYNSYIGGNTADIKINSYASIFIESRKKITVNQDDILSRPLSTSATITYTNTPWSLFAEADRAYIGSTLVLASAQTLSSTTRGAWLDIGSSQATRPHINLSAGTDPTSPQIGDLWWNGTQLYFRKDSSTSVNLLSGGTGSSSTGLTTGTNLGDGVKVLFSSDTTNLAFATLSSQTPSTLRIISSSTGVILFSATTGSSPVTGNFVPLTGTTSGSPMQGNLVFSGTNGIFFNNDSTLFKSRLTASGLSLGNSTGFEANINFTSINSGSMNISITDTATGSGYIVTVPQNIVGNENKFVKIKEDGLGFDFHDNFIIIRYIDAYNAAIDQTGSGTLIPDRWYRIEAGERGDTENGNFNTYGDIFLKAISNNRFSPDGYLLAINADYNDDGDYSDVSDVGIKYGVPYSGLVVGNSLNNDIVIWNNRHWRSNGVSITLNTPSDITSNLQVLTKDYTTRNGYIIEPQKIVYDVVSNVIFRMEDKRGNVVSSNINSDSRMIESFRFGDNNVHNNQINNGYVAILNYRDLFFNANFVKIGYIQGLTILRPFSKTLSITNSVIQDNSFSIPSNYDKALTIPNSVIQDKKINSSSEVSVSLTSQTITLGQTFSLNYEQKITSTGGTFNGIVTAITRTNEISDFNQKFEITNGIVQDITFRNSSLLKTEGGLDALLKRGDSIEIYLSGSTAYQKNINNYV